MHNLQPAIYIMANKRNGTLYSGVTTNLQQRVYQHKQAKISGFTKQYDCKQLVYYEQFDNILDAIAREKKSKQALEKRNLCLLKV